MASRPISTDSATAEGAEADELFVELMTRPPPGRHRHGDEAAEEAENEEVRHFAPARATNQQSEIVELEGLLADAPTAD